MVAAHTQDDSRVTPEETTVGVIGVGNMGGPIARQIAAVFETVAFDLDDDRLAAVAADGVEPVDGPREVGDRADVVLLSLPSIEAVEAVALEEDGVLAGLSAGDVLVDSSTIDPDVTDAVASVCDDRRVAFLDAPVSGGSRNAARGALTTMVGGDADTVDRIGPVLECYSDTITRVGGRGTGIAMKLTNNYMLGVNTAAVCEALTMARNAGIDDETFFDVASSASGDSYALRRNLEGFVLPGDYEPEGDLSILRKDVTLAEGLGRSLDVPMPIGGATSSIYRLAEDRGLADRDLAALIGLYDTTEGVDRESK
ncbi:NAD(P)-dependent oxidoreductase [Natronorubrum sp. FCH18a]|uniref:NAD(P)-dependent oxidoreductase n=1 Tax=Natronorubrum sp. FCH18a TaxID=3447018 RepID=UPI003F50F674